MATADRDFRHHLDVKEIDARGNRLAADRDALGGGRNAPDKEALGRGAGLDQRYEALQGKLDALERLVKEKAGDNVERTSPKLKKKKNKDELMKSGGASDNMKKSEFYRSSSGRPVGKSKERDTLYRSTAQGQFKSGLYDPKIEKEYVTKVRDSNYLLHRELGQAVQENADLRATLQLREDDIGGAENGIERLGMREDRLLQELELLKRENALLQERNDQLRSQLHSSVFDKQTESYLILENENLREDVGRLIKMLQNTKEYKNFADYADASGSIHYLKSIGKFSRLDLAERFKDLKNVPDCKNHELFVDEKMLWVPAAAFKFAHDFRIKYDGRLTENLIEHLLYELNKIWCQREKRISSQIKSDYNSEAEILRRKIANTPSLELNHLQAEIKRLKNDLKNAYRDNQFLHANRQDLNPAGFQYIKGALKMANEYATNKTQLEKQNKYYKEVSEAYQKVLNEDYKGNIYLAEGGKISTHKGNQLAASMRHEVMNLLKDFEAKASCLGGGSKEDLLKADQCREHYLTMVRRKLEQYCGQVDKEHRMAHHNFAQTKERVYAKK